jgi:dienelactone hydrolase
VSFLAESPESTGKVGAVGFCWGGGMANQLAAPGTAVAASVAYYGRQLPDGDVPKISAPLLLHYAGLERETTAFDAALSAGGSDPVQWATLATPGTELGSITGPPPGEQDDVYWSDRQHGGTARPVGAPAGSAAAAAATPHRRGSPTPTRVPFAGSTRITLTPPKSAMSRGPAG